VVSRHFGEASWIAKRRKDALPLAADKRDITHSAILKQQAQLVVADNDDPPDVHEWKKLGFHVFGC
jgi:hypothetical protein